MKVDVMELEKQRRKEIKEGDHYLEFTALIDARDDNENVSIPIMQIEMHKCGQREIALLYSALTAQIQDLEENYPAECLYAKMFTKMNKVGSMEVDLNKEDKK